MMKKIKIIITTKKMIKMIMKKEMKKMNKKIIKMKKKIMKTNKMNKKITMIILIKIKKNRNKMIKTYNCCKK